MPNQSNRIDDPTKGRIYVMRPTTFGGGVSMTVRDGEKEIGKTGPRGYLCWEREPGATMIMGKAENTSIFPLTVEQGCVYYFIQHVQMGMLKAGNNIELVDEAKGKEQLKNCKPAKVESGK
jgi:hypothetical protein